MAALLLLAVSGGAFAASAPSADTGAVVLMYHRFGEDAFPATNVRLAQFEAHVAELTSGKYNVLPLPAIVAALTAGTRLPDRTVAITVDDAYKSVFTEAWPRLKAAGLPFTVFVATAPVERRLGGFMTWSEIRVLRDAGVTIAAHSHSHAHMARLGDTDARAEIATSNRILRRELGRTPDIFAYPYGEASAATTAIVRASGYAAAFGQHSGVVFRGLDRFYLPRFAINESYGAMQRFRLLLDALPLQARDIVPIDPLVRPHTNPPVFGFTVADAMGDLARLACYSSQGNASIVRPGGHRIEVRFSEPFAPGRTRVNCTLPVQGARWRWLGMQFYRMPEK